MDKTIVSAIVTELIASWRVQSLLSVFGSHMGLSQCFPPSLGLCPVLSPLHFYFISVNQLVSVISILKAGLHGTICRTRLGVCDTTYEVVPCKYSYNFSTTDAHGLKFVVGFFNHVLKPCNSRRYRYILNDKCCIRFFAWREQRRATEVECDSCKQESYRVNRP